MRDNALKRPFQIITSVCDTRVTAGSYGLISKQISIIDVVCASSILLRIQIETDI